MHSSSTILIDAPIDRIFEVTSNLDNWPVLLPHYRYIRTLEKTSDRATVAMACWRGCIPISWVSHHEVDVDNRRMLFTHLRKFTKGMKVVWLYEQKPGGVQVTITHDLKFRVPALAPLAEYIIGNHFIDPVAGKTLSTFKTVLEKEQNS